MEPPAILYHWSPAERRRSIERLGLVPGKRSHSLPEFYPPYVCLGFTPRSAWILSGDLHPEIKLWDLWQVHLSDGHQVSLANDDREWRVYDRVYKRGVWYIASRVTGNQP